MAAITPVQPRSLSLCQTSRVSRVTERLSLPDNTGILRQVYHSRSSIRCLSKFRHTTTPKPGSLCTLQPTTRSHRGNLQPSSLSHRILTPAPAPSLRVCLASSGGGLSAVEPAMSSAEEDAPSPPKRVLHVEAVPVSPESFAPFGTVVLPDEDGAEFGPRDAQLDLKQGTPRVYMMRLRDRRLGFDNITHHASVTQCLASAGNGTWYLGVCAPTLVPPPPEGGEPHEGCVLSKAGHWYRPPRPEDVVVIKVEGPCILHLHKGTWHAGPLFTDPFMDFFNLELANTNVVDHTTHYFGKEDQVEFTFDP